MHKISCSKYEKSFDMSIVSDVGDIEDGMNQTMSLLENCSFTKNKKDTGNVFSRVQVCS